MVPIDSTGAVITATNPAGVVISSWKCGPTAGNVVGAKNKQMPAKYLPGTCRD